MKDVLLQAAMKLNKGRKQRKWWQRLVRTMAMAVVFCTTYALILPAITMEAEPVCGIEAHAHLDDCYTLQPVCRLNCGLADGTEVAHTHEALCYNDQGVLICLLPEIEGHTHDNSCYEAENLLVCQEAEFESHVHEDGCYELSLNLTCEQEMLPIHSHMESCLVVAEQIPVLTCQLAEHTHDETCYPAEEEASDETVYLCGNGVHTHVESCYDEGNLLCSIPAHAHEAACLVADLDLTADVETYGQWVKTLNGVSKTGNWPADVLAVAKSQVGYKESERNVIMENGRLLGYTRYGEWYGLPYEDWCAMFASFCLHYAGVEGVPQECQVGRWIDALSEQDLYRGAGEYNPKPGDLIFLDYGLRDDPQQAVSVDHVGIVAEILPATETEPATIKTIEGNLLNAVTDWSYEVGDAAIVGYGVIPEGPMTVMTYQGSDYTVQVCFGEEAGIPETAELAVAEILPGSPEYNEYYRQSVQAMLESATAASEEELAVSFVRFFDISFLLEGQKIEPSAAVNIQITYSDSIVRSEHQNGVAVHFADNSIEVLDAVTSGEEENIDTFTFEQSSFSVVGTVLSSYARTVATTATRVEPHQIDNTAATLYVLYTQIGGQYYALDGNGKAIPVTLSGNTINMGANASNDLFWSFKEATGNYTYNPIANLGTSRYLHPFNNSGSNNGITTGNPYQSTLEVNGSTFKIKGNNNYVQINDPNGTARPVTQSNQATSFYVAEVGKALNIWFDGTNGGMMSYFGADNVNIPAMADGSGKATVILPETWKSTPKYDYVIKGWYDITTQTYYPVNPNDEILAVAYVEHDTVFYADWVAATYDVGIKNEHVVASIDTSSYITTYVFDYNVLFNVLSQNYTGSINAGGHDETWSMVNNGKVAYRNANTLGFSFVDYDANGDFSYANGRDNTNVNQGDAITAGILQEVYNASGGEDLLDLLFNPDTQVIGKHYVGTGNYLFQYMDSTTENYDGIHDGYYYLDARLNAASYNQTQQRFYLYDYLERTSDSRKDGGVGQYSDFLPFNSPYLFEPNQMDNYTDTVRRPGYEYDAKDGNGSYTEYNSVDDATTNYFFGIRTDIEFFLPNDTNTQDEYGNYGNISTRGEHMIFDFHGDDDVWVFVDGELLLDIGGLHGVMFGQIDFSTGKVVSGKDGGMTTTRDFYLSEGTHTMSIYYMERGSSQSNCAIYFNIAPRYDLEITKEDIFTANKLDGAVFSIFNDEEMTSPAQLWDSEEAHYADMEDGVANDAKNTFAVVDGIAKCWGISAGKTYYIYETTPPPGYPASDDVIRITLNNRGTATIETTTLHGANGTATEGFAVIKQNVNDTLKIVALTVTNQKEGETTEVRVVKTWADNAVDLPDSITVFLTADGEPVGRTATLTAANGWSYTWTGLPKYRDTGIDEEVVYEVQEVLVPDYITTQGATSKVENHTDWIQVASMSDSKTYLLVHNGKALSYNGSFGWMNVADAKLDTGKAAQWSVTTDHDGFHLKNGLDYTLTYGASGFYGVDNDAVALNQVIYYLNSRLVVHDHDVYYQFGNNGAAVSSDGLAFTLYQKDVLTGFLTGITNTPVDEERQTYVEVNKVWADGQEAHSEDAVEIRLFADGVYTGRSVILNAENGWKSGFYDLPYYKTDDATVIVYTVQEVPVMGYIPGYSEAQILPGLPVTAWNKAPALNENDIYRFTSGNNALAVASDKSVTSANSNANNTNQQWKAVKHDKKIVLQNVGTGLYLMQSGSSLNTTTEKKEAAAVTLDGGKLKVGNQHLEVGNGYVQTTGNTANITTQQVFVKVQVTGQSGTGYTVTNSPAIAELPATGGVGAKAYILGGLLMLAAAMIYLTYYGRKRQKGGA